MKKLMPILLGLGLAFNTVAPAFAQEKTEKSEKKGKKKGKKKKGSEGEQPPSTPPK